MSYKKVAEPSRLTQESQDLNPINLIKNAMKRNPKIFQKLLTFCQSGKISPNLVTLTRRYLENAKAQGQLYGFYADMACWPYLPAFTANLLHQMVQLTHP